MPITSSDYEKSDREPSFLLMDFLRANPRAAYSLDELVEILASMGRNLARKEVERILILLEYGGKVESKKVAGVTHYKYRKFFGFSPPTRST